MPKIFSIYVNIIDNICTKVGRFVMYGVFFMMFLLILSFVTRNIINYPLMWIIEMAQFTLTAYYLLGGGYSMITDDHVRMDLFYGKLSTKGKAKIEIAVAKGKKQFDKRATKKNRDWNREKARHIRKSS